MFLKNCPSTITFTNDEVKAALVAWVNARTINVNIRAAALGVNRNGSVELKGVVPEESK